MSKHAALSPSRAKDFKQCPLLFRFRVVDGIAEPPSLAALRGTLVHSVLERLFEAPASDRVEAGAQALLDPLWEERLAARPSERELFDGEESMAEWLDSARILVGNYFRMEKPSFLEPVAREVLVDARLPSGLAIRGIIDRVDRARDGALRIVDYKTGKSPSPRFQGEALFQMRFYATAVHLSRGVLPRRTQLIYLKDGRTLTYDPVPSDVASICADLDSTWSAIEERLDSGVFEARPSRLCDWCRFKEFCPEFGGTPPAMSASGVQKLRTAKEPVDR